MEKVRLKSRRRSHEIAGFRWSLVRPRCQSLRGSWGHLFTVAAWWRCSGISRASQNFGPVALFAQFAAVAKSLAHAHRLKLLEQLAQGERKSTRLNSSHSSSSYAVFC